MYCIAHDEPTLRIDALFEGAVTQRKRGAEDERMRHVTTGTAHVDT